jgi:hypothetical protein
MQITTPFGGTLHMIDSTILRFALGAIALALLIPIIGATARFDRACQDRKRYPGKPHLETEAGKGAIGFLFWSTLYAAIVISLAWN